MVEGVNKKNINHNMFRYTCLILIFTSISLSSPLQADEQLSAILDGIRKRYGHLPGLTVTYKREIITKSMAMLGDQMNRDLATGQIHFRPPYFLRIQQDTPSSEVVITDGDTLWWYVPSKKKVYMYPFHIAGQELRLLSDMTPFQSSRNFCCICSYLSILGDGHVKSIIISEG